MDESVQQLLLQLLLLQQKDILHMKAHLMAMEKVLVNHLGPEVGSSFYADAEKLQRSHLFGGTRAAIATIEKLIVETLPNTDRGH